MPERARPVIKKRFGSGGVSVRVGEKRQMGRIFMESIEEVFLSCQDAMSYFRDLGISEWRYQPLCARGNGCQRGKANLQGGRSRKCFMRFDDSYVKVSDTAASTFRRNRSMCGRAPHLSPPATHPHHPNLHKSPVTHATSWGHG